MYFSKSAIVAFLSLTAAVSAYPNVDLYTRDAYLEDYTSHLVAREAYADAYADAYATAYADALTSDLHRRDPMFKNIVQKIGKEAIKSPDSVLDLVNQATEQPTPQTPSRGPQLRAQMEAERKKKEAEQKAAELAQRKKMREMREQAGK